MSRISRQHILTDPHGRVVSRTVEQLTDTGLGFVRVTRATALSRCVNCRRLVSRAEDLGGRCHWCGRGPLCTACETQCAVCRRGLCGRCRHGFVWGRTPIPACPRCMRSLNRRAMHEQRLLMYQSALQRQVQMRQMRLQELAMQLQAMRSAAALGYHGGRHG